MSKHSVKKRTHLRLSDLPTLQEALAACDRDVFARVVIDDFACRGWRPTREERASMCRRLNASLDAMMALTVNPQANRNWVLVPRESYVLSARDWSISWRLHAALVPVFDEKNARRLVRATGGPAASYKEVKKADKRLRKVLGPQSPRVDDGDWAGLERTYTLAPWEDTLGCKVWLGSGWCRRERYVALASAYWEMTFFGFEYDKVQARAAQEKAARVLGETPGKGASRAPVPHLDPLDRKASQRLAQRVAVINHNALYTFTERLLDLAVRLERG